MTTNKHSIQLSDGKLAKHHILPIDNSNPLVCPYCKKSAIYNEGYWRCNPCDAQIKADIKTQKPYGSLADKELQKARKNLKRVFGQILEYWLSKGLNKTQARKKVVLSICNKYQFAISDFNIDCFDLALCHDAETFLKTLNLRKTPVCPYCSENSIFIESKLIYRCDACDAQVGAHRHNKKPLGTLANAALRKARMAAHTKFDVLWRKKMVKDSISSTQARKKAYVWLAAEMGVSIDDCHIALFNEDQCSKVVEICKPYTTQRD